MLASVETDFGLGQIDGVRFVGEVGQQDVEVEIAVKVADVHAHPRLRAAEAAERGAEEQGFLAEGPVPPVHPEVVRLGVVRHIEIEPSVAREVVAHHPETPGGERGDPRPPAHFPESSAAEVPVEEIGQSADVGGVAVVLPAVGGVAGEVRVVVHVAGHEEVEPAVGVVVAEGRRSGPAVVPGGFPLGRLAAREPGGLAGVLEQRVPAVPGAEEIEVAVVVGVADRHPHSVRLRRRRPGARRRLPETEIAEVLEEPVGARPLHEVEVEVAVAVVVEEPEAGTHDFGHEVGRAPGFAASGAMVEAESRGAGDLGELPGRRSRRRQQAEAGCRQRQPPPGEGAAQRPLVLHAEDGGGGRLCRGGYSRRRRTTWPLFSQGVARYRDASASVGWRPLPSRARETRRCSPGAGSAQRRRNRRKP